MIRLFVSSFSCCDITLSGISQAGSENRAEEGALRVIPRGRHGWRFTARIKLGSEQIAKVDHKNEDISESVNSFDSGSIFLPSLGHAIARNAFVVSILFPERISYVRTVFFMIPKKSGFLMKF